MTRARDIALAVSMFALQSNTAYAPIGSSSFDEVVCVLPGHRQIRCDEVDVAGFDAAKDRWRPYFRLLDEASLTSPPELRPLRLLSADFSPNYIYSK